MIRNISIGIEAGSAKTRVAVAELLRGEKNPKIIGAGEADTGGVRHGYPVNVALLSESIKRAVAQAEQSSGIKIRRAAVALGGVTLESLTSQGETIISKADGEVTTLDIEKAIEDSESNLRPGNKKVIKAIPLSFKLDGKEVLGRPEGMRGTKLEAKILFIVCSGQHFEDLIEAVTLAGVEPTDVVPSPLSAGNIALSERHRIVGAALVNIGAETVTVGVFENESLIYLHTFGIGSSDITNDLALGMKVSLEKAEDLKLGIPPVGGDPEYPKKKLDEIIEARLSDIFELIENHLKKIKRSGLLPAGIVFIGGGSNIAGLAELSKETMKLPSRIATTDIFGSAKTKLRDPAWFPVLGLLGSSENDYGYSGNSSGNLWKTLKNFIKSGIKQLMP